MPSPQMNATVRETGNGVRVIDIHGEVTAACEKVLMDAYSEASTPGTETIVLGFDGLEYMNSGGIGLLVTMLIRSQRNGHRLAAFGLSEHYRQIFSLTRLDEAIALYDSEDDALAAS